ncbi:MAG: cbb3-type cytochrome c oxidase subunit 3 [Akkermansiaceae bacterium]|nr:cbb3-type cytochrome c oxidase subunit 3 [Verrucomicrobiales bacterium]
MIKNVLTHIGGVGAYGVISILIFMTVFVAVAIWMLCLKKSYYSSMQSLPLEEDAPLKKNSDQNRNSN